VFQSASSPKHILSGPSSAGSWFTRCVELAVDPKNFWHWVDTDRTGGSLARTLRHASTPVPPRGRPERSDPGPHRPHRRPRGPRLSRRKIRSRSIARPRPGRHGPAEKTGCPSLHINKGPPRPSPLSRVPQAPPPSSLYPSARCPESVFLASVSIYQFLIAI